MDKFLYRYGTIIYVIIAILAMLIFYVKLARAEDGWYWQFDQAYTMQKGATSGKLCISRGKYINDWLSLRAEGHVGKVWYEESSGIQMGTSFIIRFDPAIYISAEDCYPRKLRFYFDMGVGVGYTDASERPNILHPGIIGLIDGGLGFIYPIKWERVEFTLGGRYSHLSSLRPGDRGINTFGVNTGFRW